MAPWSSQIDSHKKTDREQMHEQRDIIESEKI